MRKILLKNLALASNPSEGKTVKEEDFNEEAIRAAEAGKFSEAERAAIGERLLREAVARWFEKSESRTHPR